MTSSRSLLGGAAVAAAATALALVPGAGATSTTSSYTARTLTQPAATGLPVSGKLSDYRALASARIIVPSRWQARSSSGGTAKFRVQQDSSCTYDLTYAVKAVVGAAGGAAAHVDAALPSPGARYVLDEGTRGSGAFRVVRHQTTNGRISLEGLWAGVLTKRDDIVPAGKAAWTELHVTATSEAGDECHSGTYRSALGPTIGDSLAVARDTLRFAKG